MSDKNLLRSKLLAERRAIEPARRKEWDTAIATALQPWIARHAGLSLAVYWPLPGEPDLSSLYEAVAAAGIALSLPKTVKKDAPLHFFAWKPGEPLSRDEAGVPAPLPGAPEVKPGAILIPCVGFNDNRMRLGYGAGYYDRTLAVAPRPLAIGVAYSCTRGTFDSAPHDIALDAVVTETGFEPAGFN